MRDCGWRAVCRAVVLSLRAEQPPRRIRATALGPLPASPLVQALPADGALGQASLDREFPPLAPAAPMRRGAVPHHGLQQAPAAQPASVDLLERCMQRHAPAEAKIASAAPRGRDDTGAAHHGGSAARAPAPAVDVQRLTRLAHLHTLVMRAHLAPQVATELHLLLRLLLAHAVAPHASPASASAGVAGRTYVGVLVPANEGQQLDGRGAASLFPSTLACWFYSCSTLVHLAHLLAALPLRTLLQLRHASAAPQLTAVDACQRSLEAAAVAWQASLDALIEVLPAASARRTQR